MRMIYRLNDVGRHTRCRWVPLLSRMSVTHRVHHSSKLSCTDAGFSLLWTINSGQNGRPVGVPVFWNRRSMLQRTRFARFGWPLCGVYALIMSTSPRFMMQFTGSISGMYMGLIMVPPSRWCSSSPMGTTPGNTCRHPRSGVTSTSGIQQVMISEMSASSFVTPWS